jgi:hypothetical protein
MLPQSPSHQFLTEGSDSIEDLQGLSTAGGRKLSQLLHRFEADLSAFTADEDQ